MKIRTFKRGIHPPGQKGTTNDLAIEVILPKEGAVMVYPMAQHIGAPCEPVVAVGERVLLGQLIGAAKGYVSAPVHSSVSGVVKAIGPVITPAGIMANAVSIENDGLLEEHPSIKTNDDYMNFSRDQCLEMIRAAGIVGLGGAGFPTVVKLNPPADKKIDYVIVNAAECEPYLTTDHRVLLEESDKIKIGLQLLLKIFPNARGIIAIETNKMDALKKLTALCRDDNRIEVVGLKPKYPQGAEKQLIYACTGREVPSGGLPADIGAIVDNVDTVIAIHRAIVRGRPLMRKIVTVTGGAVNRPGNFKARLGMSYRELIEQTGGFKEEPYKIISGGPMMGVAMFDLDVPIIKTSSAILCLTEKEGALPEESNCIRCSKCVQHCPAGLLPLDLNAYVLRGETDLFVKNNGLDCIECGSCSYICPAKRHLAQSIRSARRLALAERSKQAAAAAKK
ncbi:MAG: electron transport complex subunit RsxC [Clostridiales bacterium]|nr:electron transport complex subunit RsxC [Clostridiales bacterium]